MEVITYLACGLLFAILVVLILIAVIVQGLRRDAFHLRLIIESGLYYFMYERPMYPMGTTHRPEGGFCVWVFRGGEWKLEGNYCTVGYEPGPPPNRTGVIEGYAVRQLAVKKRTQ
jgi:hypothetical protein